MTYQEFKNLPKPEYDEFISKLLQAVNKSEGAFQYAQWIVEGAEKSGMYDKTKFGIDAQEGSPEMIGYPIQLS